MPYDETLEVNLIKLARIADAGWLYQVADNAAPTALLPANFVLWNAGSKGLPLRVISVRLSSTAAILVTLGWVQVDPALSAGNTPQNLRLGQGASQASFENQVVAAPTLAGTIGEVEVRSGGEEEFLLPAAIYVPPGRGLVLTTAAVAATVAAVFLWAEIENL
jgi:hypothetical protein